MLNSSPTELTTGATDAVLALECVLIGIWLWRTRHSDRWRATLWCWVFGFLALSSLLGAVAHGLDLGKTTRDALWKPLFLGLGILVALFAVGAVYDWLGRGVARRLVPWAVAAGAAFFAATQLGSGAFKFFDVYSAAALICSLMIYVMLAAKRRLRGAGVVAAAIMLDLAAAGVRASSASITVILPFDHNGLFHLVQMVGAAMLGRGVWLGLRPRAPGEGRGPDAAANTNQPAGVAADSTCLTPGSRR